LIKKKKSRIFYRTFYIQFEFFFFFSLNIKIPLSPDKVKVIIKICEPILSHLFDFDGAKVVINLDNAKKNQNIFLLNITLFTKN